MEGLFVAKNSYNNVRLYKFNIVDSPLCSLCGAYNEFKHLFCTEIVLF